MLSLAARAEVVCALGAGAANYKAAQDQRPSPDALQLADRVNAGLKTICMDHCPSIALFRNATAANAMLVAEHGDGRLVYSPQFFSAAYESFGDNGILAIIAHEMGHALDTMLGAPFVKSSWTAEVRADAWAGCLLAKMNADSPGLQQSLTALAKYPPAASTPWNQRLTGLRAGFTQCGGVASRLTSPVH